MPDRKSIPGYLGYYADRQGRIWHKLRDRWKQINPVIHAVGYQYTRVNGVKKLTQRLVCAAFKGDCPSDLTTCVRKAKGQQPRRVRSQRYLRWGTLGDCKRGKYRFLSCSDKDNIKDLYSNGMTQIDIANKFGVTQPAISVIVNS